jgi:hypothetical protein
MKNVISILILNVIIITIFYGCQTGIAYLNPGIEKYPSAQPGNVKIFSERNINKDFTEIGYVSVHFTQTVFGDDLKNSIKEKASSIGADAVIDFHIFGNTAGGIAIKFKQ